jgi:hypothetical protein
VSAKEFVGEGERLRVRFAGEEIVCFAPEKRIYSIEAVLFAGGVDAHVELAVEAV